MENDVCLIIVNGRFYTRIYSNGKVGTTKYISQGKRYNIKDEKLNSDIDKLRSFGMKPYISIVNKVFL